MKLGLCWDGNEAAVTAALDGAIALVDDLADPLVYVEIGLAAGETMAGVAAYLSERGQRFVGIGCDIPGGWSLDGSADERLRPWGFKWVESAKPGRDWKAGKRSRCVGRLRPGAEVAAELADESVSVAVIDGCHGKACAMADFLALEPKIKPGGFIIFHDAGAHCQGHHVQPHCGTGIDVRAGLVELGLMGSTRPGWTLEAAIEFPQAHHGCVVVRKGTEGTEGT